MIIEKRLAQAGFTIPGTQPSVANYVAGVRERNLLFISGQLPLLNGKIAFEGQVGKDVGVPQAKKAAELCALNILGQVRGILGDLDQINRCIRLGGFINCSDDFRDHSLVMNGASDLLVCALGDAGRHARAAVGCSSLPLNASVEVEAVFSINGWEVGA